MFCLSRLLPIASLIMVASASAAGPLDFLLQKDASGYAERMAALIDDRPECRVFKQEILAQSMNSAYAGSTMNAIATAKQKANAAGCSSPSATGSGVNGVAGKLGQAGASAINDAHGYAQRMAALIADRPECAKYKTAIMARAGGSMASGATVGPIIQAKADADMADCSSSNTAQSVASVEQAKPAQVGVAPAKDPRAYAKRLADHVSDRPECAQYKTAIMSHAGDIMGGGAVSPMVQAAQDARRAGCSMP